MAAEAGLSLTWSQTPKTGFLVTMLICIKEHKRLCRRHAVWTSVSVTCPLLLTVPGLNVTCAVWPRRGKPLKSNVLNISIEMNFMFVDFIDV